jgi:hypothetical protein
MDSNDPIAAKPKPDRRRTQSHGSHVFRVSHVHEVPHSSSNSTGEPEAEPMLIRVDSNGGVGSIPEEGDGDGEQESVPKSPMMNRARTSSSRLCNALLSLY